MAAKLLEKSDSLLIKLREYLRLRPAKLAIAERFVQAMQEFNAVRHSCFGQELSPNYTDLIQKFMVTYRSLEISIPVKVNIVFSPSKY